MSSCKYIYISGFGRSGSTLVDIILSSQDNIIGTGELCNLLTYKMNNNLNDAFWKDVLYITLEETKQKINSVEKQRFIFESFPVGYFTKFFFKDQYKNYKFFWHTLVMNVIKKDDVNILVDSSKTAWKQFFRPMVFGELFNNSFFVIHLERNYSDVKKSLKRGDNIKIEKNLKKTNLIFPSIRAGLGVVLSKLFYLCFKFIFRGKIISIKYRSFVQDPVNELVKIEENFQIDLNVVIDKIKSNSTFYATRQFSGNRLRNKPIYQIENK